MNKRVDMLFGQALDSAVPETWTTLDADQLNRLKDKFAQLIVRECSKWVNDNLGLLDEDAETDLLKHFGVEE